MCIRDSFKLLQDSPKHVFCRVSDFSRIIDSAYYFLSGFFSLPFVYPTAPADPLKSELLTKYGSTLNKSACDALYRGHFTSSSPSLVPIYSSLHKAAEERKDHFASLEPVVPKLKALFGLSPTAMDYRGFYHLNDFLECYRANDKPLPKGFGEDDVEAMKCITYFTMYDITLADEIIRRVFNYYIFKELIRVIEEPSKPIFYYFSGHDITIFGILLGLGYLLPETTTYNTGITIEVYKMGGERFVNIEYDKMNVNKLLFPGMTSDHIPIEKLLETMRKELFKSDEEYKVYTGNKDFDYERDFAEAEAFRNC
eukprot:TRINITY_DN9625_c0_g1_i6.p1 TRINITY_DN9625_c0_g1~~TRINITY_DN9625_c0_g1_i6.p1  ORF type:complete len:311 (+),score=66.96 TRINITY_DN9625_c0_g1_i6:77-1009(+)